MAEWEPEPGNIPGGESLSPVPSPSPRRSSQRCLSRAVALAGILSSSRSGFVCLGQSSPASPRGPVHGGLCRAGQLGNAETSATPSPVWSSLLAPYRPRQCALCPRAGHWPPEPALLGGAWASLYSPAPTHLPQTRPSSQGSWLTRPEGEAGSSQVDRACRKAW